MRSIKPGRGPSGMSFIGAIVSVIFGIFWTIIAFSISSVAPFGIIGSIFPLFGIIFIIIGIVNAVYHYKNTTGKNRFSIYDITDSSEEGDPADKWIKENEDKFCPYCGVTLDNDFQFCPKCGKKI